MDWHEFKMADGSIVKVEAESEFEAKKAFMFFFLSATKGSTYLGIDNTNAPKITVA